MLIKELLVLFVITEIYGKSYFTQRENLFHESESFQFGNQLKLTDKEERVDKFLIKLKEEEHRNDLGLLQENGILDTIDIISSSKVFKVIKQLPKGALLHWHDLSLTSFDKIINKWGYDDNLYTCYDSNLGLHLYKFSKLHLPSSESCQWVAVNHDRKVFGNREIYDQLILSNFTLTKEKLESAETQNDVWDMFAKSFISIEGFLSYKPVFKDYIEMGLYSLLEDNIQYAEVRALLQPLYDLDHHYIHPKQTLQVFIDVINEFKKDFKDFYRTKMVYCKLRISTNEDFKQGVLDAIEMFKEFPGYFSGFDIVGQEDTGRTQFDFIEELLLPQKLGKKLPYIFHAGETNFYGTEVDHNLHDAMLLNTSRIGHGFALMKHPLLKYQVKERKIAIEVCPISNQILGLVSDLRNHPATIMMAENLPVTISSDDPGHWKTSALSHDLYQAFMGMVPKNAGIRVLKQLFLNSIWYSSLNDKEKLELHGLWLSKWHQAIENIIIEQNL